jgi:chemotaxis protein methyltransferase CheR
MTNMYQPIRMASADFARISNFICAEYGIKLPPTKKTMLEGRLQKRLKALNLKSFSEYNDYIFSRTGGEDEIIAMVNAVTTNKTDFFREADHFDFISHAVLPEIIDDNNGKFINAWSAGCSSGEEPYSLAIVFEEFIRRNGQFQYSILGTDVCTDVLEKGRNAIYSSDRVETIPLELRKKYFLKSKDPAKKNVRIVPELRSKVSFQVLNFMDEHYSQRPSYDIIMCRNVLIYFTRATQEAVINKLAGKLRQGGYLFLGHSESITDMKVTVSQVKPTVFRKM